MSLQTGLSSQEAFFVKPYKVMDYIYENSWLNLKVDLIQNGQMAAGLSGKFADNILISSSIFTRWHMHIVPSMYALQRYAVY